MAKNNAGDVSAANVYRVVEPIEHDGTRYQPGQEIDLDDSQAAPLLERSAITAL